ncbi:MAG: hypothetical protein HY043_14275 [Verrucomicrobia bacterium]|nr:hypothetical protein [Verrucomicrobiota bacterium]
MHPRIFIVLLIWVHFASTAWLSSAETLWQIGIFDESSAEFSSINDPVTGQRRIDYADPKQDPVFVVGRSTPARDWFSFQPGSANGGAGYRSHPFMIRFDLPEAPHGRFMLRLSLLAYSARLPILQVEINGHRGWFYQHPRLSYQAGDSAVFFLPHYSTALIECVLPQMFLRKGTNELVLTAVDQPNDRDDVRPYGFPWPGSSGIVYDAIALTRDDQALESGDAEVAEIVPTIFYKSKGEALLEQIDAFLRFGPKSTDGNATLRIGENVFTQAFKRSRDFGEEKIEFDVPEFAPATRAALKIEGNGSSHDFSTSLTPTRKWNLFVAPHEHLDIGYTDYAPKVAEIQSRSVDEAIEMIERNPDFRFTLDGFWVVEEFMKGRSREQQQKFLKLIAEGKISIPAVYGSSFTGFASLEHLIRSLYPSKRFANEHGTPFDFALITDVPSYSWSHASVLASAGLKYFVAASDAYRAPFLLQNRFNESSPQWWQGPDGRKILTWYARHYHQVGSLFGLPAQIVSGRDSLPRFLQAYDHSGYKSDGVILFGTQVENTDLFPQQTELVQEWNRTYTFPKLRYAGFTEALDYIAGQSSNAAPVVRGDGGPYWEDGLGANAAITSLARRNEQRALVAEIFSTISAQINPVIAPDRGALQLLWRDILIIGEHTWHADTSVSDPTSQQAIRQGAAKDAHAVDAERGIDAVLSRGLAAIADNIPAPAGTLVVFNSLNWPRSGLIETDLKKGMELVDQTTRAVVPHEILFSGNAFHHVRFFADQVPAVGYKCFATRAISPATASPETTSAPILENKFYRIELDAQAGAVRSIFDKELNREIVATNGAHRLGQYLYVTGADELPNRLVQFSTVSPLPELKIHPAAHGRVVSVTKAPFGTVARLESSTTNAPRIETEIILFDSEKKIAFVNRVQKTKVYAKEAAYFAFPFAFDQPRFRYATQNGFVDPALDLLPGAGREWFTIQDWVSVAQDGFAITLVPVDAPLITIGDIARGAWPTNFAGRTPTIYSYVMNNYTPEGYQAGQGGELTFRYVLTSGAAFDPVKASRFGAEALTPLELNEVMRNDKAVATHGHLNAGKESFLNVEPANVRLVTWKMAEDGRGTILRFVEMGGRTVDAVAKFASKAATFSAWRCNSVEDDQAPLNIAGRELRFTIEPFAIATIRLQTTGPR